MEMTCSEIIGGDDPELEELDDPTRIPPGRGISSKSDSCSRMTMKILFTGCHYCYTIFGIARFLRRYRFAPCRKQKYVIKDKRSHRIRRNAASPSFHSMISRDSYPPRRVCPYSHTLCSPSIPESCNHCTEAHILTRSYSDSSCSEQLSRQL